MQIDISRFRETFFEEAGEHLAAMEQGLLQLEHRPRDGELLNAIFRAAHSIKGGSATFGFEGIARFTHVLEGLLDGMRDQRFEADAALVGLCLRAGDMLRGLIDAARSAGAAPEAAEALLAELQSALEARTGGATGVPADRASAPSTTRAHTSRRSFSVRFVAAADLYQRGMDPVLVLRDLSQIGTLTELRCDLQRLPKLDDLDPEVCYLGWDLRLETDRDQGAVRDTFAFVEDGSQLEVQAQATLCARAADEAPNEGQAGAATGSANPRGPTRSGAEHASIRVAIDKVDRLIDLVGELLIAQSIVHESVNHFTPERLGDLRESIAQLERYTRELQERVMSVRMVPIGSVFSRFPRLVRDLCSASGKQVHLELVGEETELDKGVVERIGDPLTHLVRNAIDHGIERPEARQAAGKPEGGLVRMSAYTQGGSVCIEISDDGRGLDTARIRAKAIERGLLAPEAHPSEAELQQMIFLPAFSTADKVTDVSGRGVGMDVVKRNVEELNGSVSIQTTPGKGTCFRIKLPLTLAILDGLTLDVGGRVFILPLVSISESLRPTPANLRTVLGRGEVVMVRGEPVPLVRLHRVFGIPTERTDPCQALVVLAEAEGQRMAILIDELLGQQQVVIKNLDAHYKRIDGVLGATILGDGRIALILDVPGLLRLALGQPAREPVGVS